MLAQVLLLAQELARRLHEKQHPTGSHACSTPTSGHVAICLAVYETNLDAESRSGGIAHLQDLVWRRNGLKRCGTLTVHGDLQGAEDVCN